VALLQERPYYRVLGGLVAEGIMAGMLVGMAEGVMAGMVRPSHKVERVAERGQNAGGVKSIVVGMAEEAWLWSASTGSNSEDRLALRRADEGARWDSEPLVGAFVGALQVGDVGGSVGRCVE
jgi:hypothetical protein